LLICPEGKVMKRQEKKQRKKLLEIKSQ